MAIDRKDAKPVEAQPDQRVAQLDTQQNGWRAPLSGEQRAERGTRERTRVPHESHADWAPWTGRFDPVALLLAQEDTRLAELLPIRHGRMLASPFSFYRG